MGTFGYAIAICGAILVDRFSEAGRKAINEAAQRAKSNGTSMFVFPEGTRNRKGGMLAFKKGAFHVALDIGVPILPIVISEYEFLGPSRHDQFPPAEITIKILPPIDTERFDKDAIDDLVHKTRETMIRELNAAK